MSHDFKDVWGRSIEDFWAVGNAGYIAHGGPDGLTVLPSEAELSGVWGSAAEDVWAVGDGVIAHWDGTAWTETRAPRMPAFLAVQAQRSDLAWALSARELWRWDGTKWEPYRLPVDLQGGKLHALFVNPRGELYIAGEDGTLLRLYRP